MRTGAHTDCAQIARTDVRTDVSTEVRTDRLSVCVGGVVLFRFAGPVSVCGLAGHSTGTLSVPGNPPEVARGGQVRPQRHLLQRPIGLLPAPYSPIRGLGTGRTRDWDAED